MAKRTMKTLNEQLTKAKALLVKRKNAYDRAAKDYKDLLDLKERFELQELTTAYRKSGKSLEEALVFFNGTRG